MKKFSRFLIPVAVGVAIALPLLAAAQTGININYITPYSSGIINVINRLLVPVIIAIAFVVFIWGVYKYFIYGADNETERETGRQFVLWGVIGFVIILSLWGLVNLVMGTFGLSVGSPPPFPTIGNATGVTTSGNQVFTGGVTTGAQTGSNIFNPDGSFMGRVNSRGEIVNNTGRVVGTIRNGQPYTNSGTAISGATVGNASNQGSCDAATEADCEAAGKTCDASSGTPQCVSASGTDDTTASPALSNCLDTCTGTCNENATTGVVTCEPTTAGYGSGTQDCTPPEVQSPEGGCYTPVDTTPAQEEATDASYCTDLDTGDVVPC